MRLLGRVLVALIAVAFGWLAVGSTEIPASAPAQAELAYTYDAQYAVALSAHTTTERGPPSTDCNGTTYDPDGLWPLRVSARSEGPTPLAVTAYIDPMGLVQVAQATGTTVGQARCLDRDGSSYSGTRTAPKGADDVAQVTKNRIAGNEFRDSVAARLEAEEGFAVLGKEVGVKTPFGWRYLDILAQRNGGLVNFETKLGGSRYLPSQRAKDWWISRVGVDLGDGSPTQIPTVLIRGPLS